MGPRVAGQEMTSKTIAVVGRSGQVASALLRTAEAKGIALAARGRPDIDLEDIQSVAEFLYETQPGVVVNAAAYTAVDKAESEPDAAFRLNAAGPARLAVICAAAGVPLIHISTDYVFDGAKQEAYAEDDAMRPLSVYGASKAAGEAGVRNGCPQHIILRTSWVYDGSGQNFLTTMLRLGATRDVLRVVNDQHGSPTHAGALATAILDIARQIEEDKDPGGGGRFRSKPWGTYHMTGGGVTTWHGFATEIFRLARAAGMTTPRLEPIPSSDYPTPAQRPKNSVLDNRKLAGTFGVTLPSWQAGVAAAMARSGA